MDVTRSLADAVDKITAALPGVEASVATDLAAARDAIQSEIDRMEADGEKLVAAMAEAGNRFLGAENVRMLGVSLLGANDLMELLERGIVIKLGPKVSA